MSPPPKLTTYPLPTYIYKILPTAPPTPLPPTLPLSPLDLQDGFIHLSTAAQVPITASLFFAPARSLALLKISARAAREASAGGVFRWVEGMPGCPHLYAPSTDAAGRVLVPEFEPESAGAEAEAKGSGSQGYDSGAKNVDGMGTDRSRDRDRDTRRWAELGSANVVGSRVVERAEDETWADAFARATEDGWLVDE